MSIQDPITYPAGGNADTASENLALRYFAFGSVICLLFVLAWSVDLANVAQIFAMALVLSIGLSARAVMRIDEVEDVGLPASLSLAETIMGSVILSALAAVSLITASVFFAPLGGAAQLMLFAGSAIIAFAAVLALETIVSTVACFVLKPILAKSAIGAEVAVMLNLQQKYQTRLT